MARLAANHSGISPSLLLALLGSVLLHLGVLFGAHVMPPPQAYTPHPIEARLARPAPLGSPAEVAKTPAPASTPIKPMPGATAAPIAPAAPEATASNKPAPSALQSESPAPAMPAQPNQAGVDDGLPDPVYYSSGQLDEPPRLLGNIQQVYPARARNAGIEGFVTLSLLINERGEVDEISVVKSQPTGFFEESALAMLRGQRFTPAIRQGKAVRSRWQKTFRFKLQD